MWLFSMLRKHFLTCTAPIVWSVPNVPNLKRPQLHCSPPPPPPPALIFKFCPPAIFCLASLTECVITTSPQLKYCFAQ